MDREKKMIERGMPLYTDRKFDKSSLNSIRKLFLDDVDNGMMFSDFLEDSKYVINKDTGYTSRRFETPLPGNSSGYRYVNRQTAPEKSLSEKALRLMKHTEDLVGMTGIYSSKYSKNEIPYGKLTYTGEMRTLLYNLRPYFYKGMLKYNGKRIDVDKNYDSPYINNVVNDINTKLAGLPDSVVYEIIRDSGIEMAPMDEVEKEYRIGLDGLPFLQNKTRQK